MSGEPSPKDRFTALDTYALVRELRAWVGARIDKVYDASPAGYACSLRAPPSRRAELLVVPGRYAAVLAASSPHDEALGPFARELRRLLSGAAIRRIAEPGGERYLELELARPGESSPLLLAVELFGQGNVVVARDGRVVAVAHARSWAHRSLRVGSDYARPPARDDPWTLGAERIRAELETSRNDLASTLAARLALGGPVAEEVIARGGWDPSRPASEDAAGVAGRLTAVLRELLAEIGPAPAGCLVLREEVAVDASPYRPARWADAPGVRVEDRTTFSEAAHAYFADLVPRVASAEEKAREAELASLRRLEERQQRAAEELRAAALARKDDAERLYAHYAEAEAQLAAAERAGPDSATAEIELAGVRFRVLRGKGVDAAARALYEEAKRLGAKLAGAEEALRETRGKRTSVTAPERAPAKPATTPARVRWFEKFRWFVSSEGVLALAGRDAGSNDVLVRRHLKAGDRYLHADLQGAASVVVKRPQGSDGTIGERTLREAAQWAVAYSKAWRAGLASANAFWAEPEQVSKSPETGEFVARGAWIVRGTKHVVRDVPLELALGEIDYEGARRWTVAPPDAVRARGEVRCLLAPGEERDRGKVEADLARELGVPRTVLQRLLPAGGLSVRRA